MQIKTPTFQAVILGLLTITGASSGLRSAGGLLANQSGR